MDDDELLRALTRIAQQDPGKDPRRRKLADDALPGGEQGAEGGAAARAGEEGAEREARVPLDDETRARLADQLVAQLREPRGDAPAPLSSPIVDRKSGIRIRGPHEWDSEAEEPDDAVEPPQLGADADSLSGTSSPLNSDAPVCRSIGGESEPPGASDPPGALEPPRGACSSAAPGPAAACALDGADAVVLAPRAVVLAPRERPLCPELRVERRTARRSRSRSVAGAVGWAAAAALVSLLALRPAPFAPGAAPLPQYAIATTLGDVPLQGDREPGASADVAHVAHVGRGARLTIALAPGGRVHAPVDVKAFLVQGGSARPWPVAIDLDERGGAIVSGTREALFKDVAAGAWEVVFVIGQPGSLPEDADDEGALPDERAVHLAGGRLLRQRLFLD
ncbi:hypothetical protein [Sorangium sp. So ce406]|uniref:hypothetical protein n=1 Tax=Sorangium sp. So ce406 TaxID=3133311 RepID=UPI003F5C0C55